MLSKRPLIPAALAAATVAYAAIAYTNSRKSAAATAEYCCDPADATVQVSKPAVLVEKK